VTLLELRAKATLLERSHFFLKLFRDIYSRPRTGELNLETLETLV